MGHYELKAADLVVTKWRPMTEFPKDGSVVEIQCDTETAGEIIVRGQWMKDHNGIGIEQSAVPGKVKAFKAWRPND